MKNWILAGVWVGLSLSTARADYQKGSQTLSVHLGGGGYNRENDFVINNKDTELEGAGVVGLQYFYFLRQGPTLALGLDMSAAGNEEESDSTFIPGNLSRAQSRQGLYQVMLKLAYPTGRFRPYIFGGVGAARSMLNADYKTPTGEVTTFDSAQYGFLGSTGVGLEFFIGERFFLAPEWRVYFLSQNEHTPTEAGRALGIESVRDPSSLSTILLRIGWKFGAK